MKSGSGLKKKSGERGIQRGHRSQSERAANGQGWNKSSKKIRMVLDYNPKNKVNIHESILLKMTK